MIKVIRYATRRSLAAAAELSTEEILALRRRHIAEIIKDLAPPQSEDLNYDQQQWLRLRMRSPMGKPYKRFTPVEIPYKWQEGTKTCTKT
jgi:hypothetical protein